MTNLDKISSLAKRRGFVYPGSEIYGGIAGFWDYGPLGVLMKENIKAEWLRWVLKDEVHLLDSAIISNPKVWEASGHVSGFSDPLVECKKCHRRFRDDGIEGGNCPNCKGSLTESRDFNLMFETHVGSVRDSSSVSYLRPETAQGIFINFKNVIDSVHPKIPFGLAQIGKAFRNEITPRNFLFRMREFEQMELEYFFDPKETTNFFKQLKNERMDWFLSLGIRKENLRFHDYEKDELAHYSSATTDIEYRFGLSEDGFSELEGVSHRADYDLKNHFPGYLWTEDGFVQSSKKNGFIPNVIEPSLGLDRAFMAFLVDAYQEEEIKEGVRTVLKIHPRLAPYKVAVFPLLANKPELLEKAKEVYKTLKNDFRTTWDERGNIGKRYRAQDEAGTPFCVTVDFESLENDDVTIRNRDTMEQVRVEINKLKSHIIEKLG